VETYEQLQRRAWLFTQVTSVGPVLRDQLRALLQLAHNGANPEDVAAVQRALFEGYRALQ
jgi:hypothetical protein